MKEQIRSKVEDPIQIPQNLYHGKTVLSRQQKLYEDLENLKKAPQNVKILQASEETPQHAPEV